MTTRGGVASRARWYADRLCSMPLAELPHRVMEALHRHTDRGGSFAARHSRAPNVVRDRTTPAFPLEEASLQGAGADDRTRISRQAADIAGDRLVLLGERWPAGARTDWSLDPASGTRWDWQRFCFDIDRRHGRGPGDAKFVWELSRLQYLQILALDAYLSGNRVSRDACLHDLASWIAGNPPFKGLGYACGVDLASRVLSVLVVVALLGPSSIPPELRGAIWDMFNAHGEWLARYPSLYSSANNHLVAEASGLFALGCLAGDLPGAATWLAMGREHLERETARQIHGDGVGAEQTPSYQASTMEWLLVVRHIARATEQRLDPIVDERLSAGAAFLAAILDNDGNHPRFGDDDDGVVLRQDLGPEQLPLAIAGTVGALFGNGALCHPAYRLDFRARLLGAYSLAASSWRPASTTFSEGGYSVLRTGNLLVLFDHGPLGYAFTAGHAHADALAVWLHVDGTPLLVDAGTYRYNHDAGWREHLRSTAAHNTVMVDGLDQSDQTGPFNWGRRRACGKLLEARLEKLPRVTACHDGYAHIGVVHERTVALEENSIRIEDRVSGKGRHHVRLTFQFAPGCNVAFVGDRHWHVRCENGPTAELDLAASPLVARIAMQTSQPGPGAVSPCYNKLVAAPALLCEGDVDLPAELVTTITITSNGGD